MHATTKPLELHILDYDVPAGAEAGRRALRGGGRGACPSRSRRGSGSSWPSWRVDGDRRDRRPPARLGGLRDDPRVRVGPADHRLRLLRDHDQRPVPRVVAGHGLRHRAVPAAREAPRDPRGPVASRRRSGSSPSTCTTRSGWSSARCSSRRPARRCGGWASSTASTWSSSWSRSGACSRPTRRSTSTPAPRPPWSPILAPFTLGAVFGVLAAKAYWFGLFTPILMVASAFLAGTALLGIVFYLVYRLRLADFERAAPIALPVGPAPAGRRARARGRAGRPAGRRRASTSRSAGCARPPTPWSPGRWRPCSGCASSAAS